MRGKRPALAADGFRGTQTSSQGALFPPPRSAAVDFQNAVAGDAPTFWPERAGAARLGT
jgi:hypothetical protein